MYIGTRSTAKKYKLTKHERESSKDYNGVNGPSSLIVIVPVPDTSISTVASSPLVTLISRLSSPNNAKYDEKAEDP